MVRGVGPADTPHSPSNGELVDLDEQAGEAGTVISYTPMQPTLPQIDLSEAVGDAEEGGQLR